MESNYIGPGIMLGFGLISAVVGAREYVRLGDNPSPLAMQCDAAAIEAAPAGRWVKVESCEPSLDDMFVLERDGDVQGFLVPLAPRGASAEEPPIAFSYIDDIGVRTAYEDVVESPADEAASTRFATKLDASRVEGSIEDRRGGQDDRVAAAVRERYTLPPSGLVSIDRGDIPKRSTMYGGFGLSIVLLPLGIMYWRRAQRQPPPQTRPLPPGLPR